MLVITRKAQGDFTNDWLKNKAIDYADHTRVYRFDAVTKLPISLEVVVDKGGRNISVLELTRFTYNEALSPALFALHLPADVNWIIGTDAMPPAPVLADARAVTRFFFDAMAREDWNTVSEVLPLTSVPDAVKAVYGGLTISKIGEPFRSGKYRGWFVPYEVRLRNGDTKRFNLAVRNDNPQQRWMVDGGW